MSLTVGWELTVGIYRRMRNDRRIGPLDIGHPAVVLSNSFVVGHNIPGNLMFLLKCVT